MKPLLVRLGVILIGLTFFGYGEVCKADGAWVLWQQESGKDFKKWEVVRGYPTYKECVRVRDCWFDLSPSGEKFKEIAKSSPSAPDPNCPKCIWVQTSKDGEKNLAFMENGIETVVMAPNMIIRGSTEKGFLILRNECFPDTIDPRK